MFDIALIIQIFILMTPLSSFPILISAYKNKLNIQKIAIRAVLIAFAISLLIVLIGPFLFKIFGITIDSFRIAGGIVLVLLGIEIIRDKEKDDKKVEPMDGLISILATPVLVGPATISFLTIKTLEIGKAAVISNLVFAFILLGLLIGSFILSIKRLNLKIIGIISRIFGLFLAALGIEMIIIGIRSVF